MFILERCGELLGIPCANAKTRHGGDLRKGFVQVYLRLGRARKSRDAGGVAPAYSQS